MRLLRLGSDSREDLQHSGVLAFSVVMAIREGDNKYDFLFFIIRKNKNLGRDVSSPKYLFFLVLKRLYQHAPKFILNIVVACCSKQRIIDLQYL